MMLHGMVHLFFHFVIRGFARIGAARTHWGDGEINIDFAGFFENEGCGKMAALFQWLFQIQQHEMIAIGHQSYFGAQWLSSHVV